MQRLPHFLSARSIWIINPNIYLFSQTLFRSARDKALPIRSNYLTITL